MFSSDHGHWLFKISGGVYVCITNFLAVSLKGIRMQLTETTKNIRNEWSFNYRLFTCLCSCWIPRICVLVVKAKLTHMPLKQLHYLWEMFRWETLQTTVNMQQRQWDFWFSWLLEGYKDYGLLGCFCWRVCKKFTDVWDVLATSIISVLMMDAASTSETLANFYPGCQEQQPRRP
jgi:hypothetical protein